MKIKEIQDVIDAARDPNLGGVPGHLNPEWVAKKLEDALTVSDQDRRELCTLFHELWTKNVGQEGYDKSKWKELAEKVRKLTGIEL